MAFIKGFGLKALFLFIYKILKKFLKALSIVISFFADIIVFLGLHFLFFYFLIATVLFLFNKFTFLSSDPNSILFYVGISLNIIISLIISFSNIFLNKRKYNKFTKKTKKRLNKKNSSYIRETPLIYRSNYQPHLLIHEYKNYYDIYILKNNKWCYLERKPKLIKNNSNLIN